MKYLDEAMKSFGLLYEQRYWTCRILYDKRNKFVIADKVYRDIGENPMYNDCVDVTKELAERGEKVTKENVKKFIRSLEKI